MADNGGFCSNLTSARDIFYPFRRDELKIKVHSVDDMIARALEEAKKDKPDFWAIYKPTRRDVKEFTAATHEFARAYGSALDNHLLGSTTQSKDGHEAKPDKTVPSYRFLGHAYSEGARLVEERHGPAAQVHGCQARGGG